MTPRSESEQFKTFFRTLHGLDDADFREIQIAPFKRALDIAYFNGWEPVRFVLSRRVSRRLGSPIEKVYGIPVQVDPDTDEGFGLVVRSP